MSDTRGQKQKFFIEMTPSEAQRAQELLGSAGIQFEPLDSAVVWMPEDDKMLTMTSADLDHALEKIREYLSETGSDLTIPDPLSLEQNIEALQMAYWQFDWERYAVANSLYQSEDEMTAKYPQLFNAPPEDDAQEQ